MAITVPMSSRKRIALIAHDNCKEEMLDWARYNRGTLSRHELFATGTTGTRLSIPRRQLQLRHLDVLHLDTHEELPHFLPIHTGPPGWIRGADCAARA